MLVFVYGTLKKGFGNHHLLHNCPYKGKGHIQGTKMLNLGAFPGMIPDESKKVQGELYEINEFTLKRLDRLEGHPHFYTRHLAQVHVPPSGASAETPHQAETVDAWAYYLSADNASHYSELCPVVDSETWPQAL